MPFFDLGCEVGMIGIDEDAPAAARRGQHLEPERDSEHLQPDPVQEPLDAADLGARLREPAVQASLFGAAEVRGGMPLHA